MEETKEVKKFIGTVRVDNELKRHEFKIDGDPGGTSLGALWN